MNKYELTLNDYWRIIRRRKGLFFLSLGSVVSATALFTVFQTPVYEANCLVRVNPPISIAGASLDTGWDAWTGINTEVKVIKGMEVAAMAVKKLSKPDASPEEIELAAARVRSSVTAKREEESNIIRITAQAQRPREALDTANAVVEAYIEYGIDTRNKKARELRAFIEIQMNESEQNLKVAEENLRKFLSKSKTKGMGASMAARLLSLEEERATLLKTYTAEHPAVAKLDSQIKAVKNRMQALPGDETEFARTTRQVKLNEDLYVLLVRRFKEAQISEAERDQNAFLVSRAALPESPVYPNVPLNMVVGTALGIFLGILAAFLRENLDTSIGTIEDVEIYLQLPVLGIVPHIVSPQDAVAFAAVRHRLASLWPFSKKTNLLSEAERRHAKRRAGSERRFSSPQEKVNFERREEKDRRLMADRRNDLQKVRSSLIVFQPNGSPFVEAYHTLRTNIQWKFPGSGGKALLFTSAGAGEGKTITSCNFALAAARTGLKTLLIESDLRKPMIGSLFGLSHDPGLANCTFANMPWPQAVKGTSDFLMGELALDQLMQTPGIENFYIMTCGMTMPNPIDIFNTKTLGAMIKDLKNNFDLIILDCSPVLLFADSLILGMHTDGAILVYQAGRIAREALKRSKDQLTNSHIPVLGVVLNNLHATDMEPRYGNYYAYYATTPSTPEKKRRIA